MKINMRILAAALVLGIASTAQAQWTQPQESEFTQNCLDSCSKNAGPDRCKSHCSCMLSELKIVLPDYASADEGAKRSDPAIIKKVGEAGDVCAKRR